MYHMPGDKYHIAGVQVRGLSTGTKEGENRLFEQHRN